MKTRRILRWMFIALIALVFSGCSTIRSWFPDKERDYQFTSEIPDLLVPDDLKNKSLAFPSSSPAQESVAEQEITARSSSAPEQDIVNETESASQANDATEQASIIATTTDTNVSSLLIDQAKTPAARMVGRALSRKQLEIVERNIEKGYFYINFDPHAIEPKDESIWDELTFLFGEDPSHEQEYRISVHQVNEQMSEVTVQDSSGKTLSNPVANALLKLITEGINEVVNPAGSSDTEMPVEQKEAEKTAEDAEKKQ